MPTFSRNFADTLHRAVAEANRHSHEFATLEHLLWALTEDADAAAVLKGCDVDPAELREEVATYIDNDLRDFVLADKKEDAWIAAAFQRVIQRAIIHVQSISRDEMTGADVLVALFSERDSHAAFFLQQHDMMRYDAVNFIVHGISKVPRQSEPAAESRGQRRIEIADRSWGLRQAAKKAGLAPIARPTVS